MKTKIYSRYAVVAISLMATAIANADDIQQLKQDVAALQALVQNHSKRLYSIEVGVSNVNQKLQFVSVNGTDMKIQSANVQLESSEQPGTVNGYGNLILGWNAARMDNTDYRGGSHFLILGNDNNYIGDGGIVAGNWNEVSGGSAIVSGNHLKATGMQSVALTGGLNEVSSTYGLIGTGLHNTVSQPAEGGTIWGGNANTVSGMFGTVLSGNKCFVESKYGSILTGYLNSVFSGDYGVILGGNTNSIQATGTSDMIVSGRSNSIFGADTGIALLTGYGTSVAHDAQGHDYNYKAFTEGVAVHP